jgi:hypothetical protein
MKRTIVFCLLPLLAYASYRLFRTVQAITREIKKRKEHR